MKENRCRHWLPKKQRFCANLPLGSSQFCGNHIKRSESEWIPCPIDSSHSVIRENLQWHIKRCPFLKQFQSLISQPFYNKGINGGRDVEEENAEVQNNESPRTIPVKASFDHVTSSLKRTAIYSMKLDEFLSLINKIMSIHDSVCKYIRDSYRLTDLSHIWIGKESDRKLPFQEKHVVQQASILRNLEYFGVLKGPFVAQRIEEGSVGGSCDDYDNPHAVVELGAGRGYLTQMLADCYGINQVYLVDRKSYKLKADRSLRQKESLKLERLRIDSDLGIHYRYIPRPTKRDFPSTVKVITTGKTPKHVRLLKSQPSTRSSTLLAPSSSHHRRFKVEDLYLDGVESLCGVPYLAVGKHLCGSATDLALSCCLINHSNMELRGLAIATCCHHLCQWKHYINKRYITDMGLTKEDFNAITWFTSWAVDMDHGSELPDITNCSLDASPLTENHVVDADGVEEYVRNMKATERAMLGFMCKQIIDTGRSTWIKEQGFEAELVKYVPPTISPENHLLIASHTVSLKLPSQ